MCVKSIQSAMITQGPPQGAEKDDKNDVAH